MQYAWKDGARTGGLDAGKVGAVLDRINRRDGVVTADAVLREGRKKRSPLHSWFEWDETEAAHQYRLIQARSLVRSITVNILGADDEEITVRAFVHIEDDHGYEDVHTVLSTVDRRALLLVRVLGELQQVRRKYADIEELAAVFAAIDEAAA